MIKDILSMENHIHDAAVGNNDNVTALKWALELFYHLSMDETAWESADHVFCMVKENYGNGGNPQ